MRISDWSSDVCSSDLTNEVEQNRAFKGPWIAPTVQDEPQFATASPALKAEYCTACNNFVDICISSMKDPVSEALSCAPPTALQRLTPAQMPELISLTSHPTPQHRRLRPRQYQRSEEHTSELQSLMRTSYAV